MCKCLHHFIYGASGKLDLPSSSHLQALVEHEEELQMLTSSHVEVSRTLRYHLNITRGAMRRVIGSVEGFKKQV